MRDDSVPKQSATGLHVGMVVSRYHTDVTDRLWRGAAAHFKAAGGSHEGLSIVRAPGTFELPLLCRSLAERPDVDAVVAIGCVIEGETDHFDYICQAAAHGLTDVSLATGKPVTFGVLTCRTIEQAMARAGGSKGNKGAEAMAAAIEAVHALTEARGAEVRRG